MEKKMDWKSFRENKLNLTQTQFAELIGEEQSQISRWEKSGDMPIRAVMKICQQTGLDFNTLFEWEKPELEALNVKNSWSNMDFTKHSLTDYIETKLREMDAPRKYRKKYIDDIQVIINNIRKPKLAIVGRSDAGKSTMINALLGAEKMPADWTPTTSIAVYIKHISDKPSFIEEETWVFASDIEDEAYWDERKLNDEEYCRKWKIGEGSIDVLRSYGIRDGENYSKNAGSAVVFLDAPILQNCDIIDLPGFGTGIEKDDDIALKGTKKADVIIYLSQANSFMQYEDMNYLRLNIKELPVWEKSSENELEPLSNLFIVASQANSVHCGNREELRTIITKNCDRLIRTLPDHYWDDREAISGYHYSEHGKEELQKRFFTYSTDIPELRASFNEALRSVIETLPKIAEGRIKKAISEYVNAQKPNLKNEIQTFEELLTDREKYVNLLSDINSNEFERVRVNNEKKQKIRNEILELKEESINEYSKFFLRTVNVDTIVSLIEERKIKNKHRDIEEFAGWLQEYLTENCELILKEKSSRLESVVKEYVDSFINSISVSYSKQNLNVDFDAKWFFAEAIAKGSVLGGVGSFVWGIGAALFQAATLAGITTVGFSTAIVSTVGFGPIGIAVGAALFVALKLINVTVKGWQKSVAKKFVKSIDEKDVAGMFRKEIENYWDNTEEEFNEAAKSVDEKWEQYVEGLKETVNNYDVEAIKKSIGDLRNIESFFENIPL